MTGVHYTRSPDIITIQQDYQTVLTARQSLSMPKCAGHWPALRKETKPK